MKNLAREPLLHFLVLAAILFAFDYYWTATRKEKIVVDRQSAEYLIEQREFLELRELSPAERETTIDAFIEDEIMYREAYKRGLDQGDTRMRRNLILKKRGLPAGDVRQPTEEELREYFDANTERFTRPATLSLEHVLFGDQAQVPDGLLTELHAGRDPASVGESRMSLPRSMPRMSQEDLARTFGPDTARAILDIDNDRWYGPFESIHGKHFLRIVDRTAPMQASFEDVRDFLEGDWRMQKSRQAIEQEIEQLSDDYEIVIENFGGQAQ